MGYAKVQVRLWRSSQMPEDAVVNTFHFSTPTAGQVTFGEANAIKDALTTFYGTAAAPSTTAIGQLLSTLIFTSGHRIKVYDMEAPIPRVPVIDDVFTLPAHTGTPFPAEVSLCLSFKATPQSGVPQARLRGRIYIGPLGSTGHTAGTDDLHPATTVAEAVANAGLRLADDANVQWCTFSEVTGLLSPVTSVWVDNVFDTQRRRGAKASSRVVRP